MRNKKGYSMIEVLFTMCILSIIFSIEINMLCRENLKYKMEVQKDRELCYLDNAFIFIENELNDIKNKNVLVKDNEVIIEKFNGDINKIDSVMKSKDKCKIRISYDKVSKDRIVNNTILDNIQKFKIWRNKNVVFVKMEFLKGKNFEKCIGLKKQNQDL